ncbi:MAG: DUF4375 domain-containing protein [Phycisphaerae bacterium]
MKLSDTRCSDRGALGEDYEDMNLVDAVVEPIWYFPTPAGDSSQLPDEWRVVGTPQREAYALVWLEREVSNGGFAQFFSNPWGYFTPDVLAGCQRFGLPEVERIVRLAIQVFPGGMPSRVRQERERVLNQRAQEERAKGNGVDLDEDLTVLNDFVFDELNGRFYDDESMYARTAAYVRSHVAEFFR